ncbi:MAG: site-specific integrase [Myxococcales bacterium]|nr:site-specific integrase [Myxococcales bacterium]
MKISKRSVDGVEPEPGRDVYLWDTELKGFAVKVKPSGSKTFVVRYHSPVHDDAHGGKSRTYTIGRYGAALTPELARAEAKRVLAEVALGRDPADEKAAAKGAGMTVGELCDLYRAEGSALKKPATLKMDRSRIDCHIRPTLGTMQVSAVKRADVERLLQRIATGGTATMDRRKGEKPNATHLVRGGTGAATRTVALFQAILEFACNRGILAVNVAKGVKRFKGKKIERFLSELELARLGDALADLERCGVYNAAPLQAIRLLTLTGCRRNEVLELRWEYLDEERSLFRLPDSKTGQKIVQIGADALGLLNRLPRDPSGWIFPGDVPGEHYKNIARVWEAVRKRAELRDVRLHDLRHTFASRGVSDGASLPIIGRLLGHSNPSTTQRYAHLSDDPLRAAADRTSRTIAAAMLSTSTPQSPVPTTSAVREEPDVGVPELSSSPSPSARSVCGPMRAARPRNALRGQRPGA